MIAGSWPATVIALVALAATAIIVLSATRVERPWEIVVAVARATVQLAALSVVLLGVLQSVVWVAVGLSVMFLAAAGTAAFRARLTGRSLLLNSAAMIVGPMLAMVIVFATGALALEVRFVLAFGGIVIGNTMTIAILTRRLLLAAIIVSWAEVEGWLALGARPRQSTAWLVPSAIRNALLPSIDQTRTTGLVVLPGAFVGAVFAGASPVEAGRFQIIVLAGVLAAGAVTAALVAREAGAVDRRPGLAG